MKNLILVRHAKTHPADYGMLDINRPLMERGFYDAEKMGKRLANKPFVPDLIICSEALRARTTAIILAKELHYQETSIQQDVNLYEAWSDDVLRMIQAIPDTYDRVLIVGHNPTFTDMVEYLSGILLDELPTAGIAHFQIPVNTWKEVQEHSATLLEVDYPKNSA